MNAPPKELISKQSKALMLLANALFSIVSIFCAGAARAQTFDPPSIEDMIGSMGDGDTFKRILEGVLGDFAKNPLTTVGMPTSMLGDLIGTYNIIVFGALMTVTVWMLISIVVKGATTGSEVFGGGKTGWLPVRTGVAIFGSLPVFGGFTGLQAIVMIAVLAGSGAANMVLDAALKSTEQLKTITPSITSATSAPNLSSEMKIGMGGLFVSELCIQMHDIHGQAAGDAPRLAPARISTPDETGWDYGRCGRVSIVHREGSDARDNTAFGFRVNAVNYDGIAKSVQQAAVGALDSMRATASMEASKIADIYVSESAAPTGDYSSQMGGVLATLMQSHQLAVAELNNNIRGLTTNVSDGVQDSVTSRIREKGWTEIGAYFSVFAEVSAALADAQRAFAVEVRTGSIVKDAQENFGQKFSGRVSQHTALGKELRKYAEQVGLVENIQARKSIFDRILDGSAPIFNPIGSIVDAGKDLYDSTENDLGHRSLGQLIVVSIASATTKDSGGWGLVNPVIAAKNLGDMMMGIGQAGLAVGAGAQLIPAGRVLSGVLDTIGIGSLLTTIMYLFIAVGMLLSIYLTSIFWLTWISAVVRYICHVIQAMLHTPLAALGHIQAEGDDFVRAGSGGQKYWYMLLDVFLRPSLMVISFFFASGALILAGTFANDMFIVGMASAQGNSTTGVLTILGFLILYFFMMFGLIQMLCNLVNVIPDGVLSLFGSEASNAFGQNNGSSVMLGAAAGNAMTSAGSSMQAAAGGIKAGAKAAESGAKASPNASSGSGGQSGQFQAKHFS